METKEIQTQKKLNRKEQKLYDALLKCSGFYHHSNKERYAHIVHYLFLTDNTLERDTILYELLYKYRKYVYEKKLDVCKYEREYGIKKVNVNGWTNKEWDYEVEQGLDEEVAKGNKVAIDIQNTLNWLEKEIEEDLESRDIVLTLVKYGLF